MHKKGIKADIIVVDPPRKGSICLLQSCNPATLARDLKYLTEHGYVVGEVQPADMFPQTVHTYSFSKSPRTA